MELRAGQRGGMFLAIAICVFVVLGAPVQAAQPCPTSFTQAISDQGNLLFLSSAIRLGGFTSKLPDPSVGVTVFAPTNSALWKLMSAMNLGFLDIMRLGSRVNGILLYHVLLGGHDSQTLVQAGSDNTLLGLALAQQYPLNFSASPVSSIAMNIRTLFPANNAAVVKSIKVCQSYIHVIDQVLIPTATSIDSVPQVNLDMLSSLASSASAPAAPPLAAPLGPVDPTCNTTFVEVASRTAGMDVLVQAIQRAGLEDALPPAGSGVTVFAPTNAAFLQMMQALNLDIASALALGDKLQSILLYHFVAGVHPAPQLPAARQLDSMLGMQLGSPYMLQFAANGPQVTVSGKLANNVATISGTIPVCNSLVHVIDAVLIPAPSLAAVPHPHPTDGVATPLPPAGQPASAPLLDVLGRLAAAPAAGPLAAPAAPGMCPDSLLSVAQANGLTFLVQALQAGKLVDKLPNPETQVTVFAPVNGAFYNILTGTDFGVDQLAALGDRFTSVLLYHIVPSGAFSLQELLQLGTANTLLGTSIDVPTPLGFSATENGWALVHGLYPNNTARVTGNATVCNSIMYFVDEVLIPADTLEDIPSPHSALAPTGSPRACNTSVLDVLNADLDLALLVDLLGGAGIDALAQDPSSNLTVFAPTNQAVIDALDSLNLTLAEFEAMPGKVKGIVQYHVLAGGRTASQLVAAQTQPAFVGPAYPLRFEGVKSGVMVSARDSQAQIVAPDLRACASVVHKIDMVLLPGTTLEDIPGDATVALDPSGVQALAPASASAPLPDGAALLGPRALPSTAAGASTAALPTAASQLAGVGFGAGYYSGCQVAFSKGTASGSGTTDASGRFSVAVAGASPADLGSGYLRLPVTEGCVDVTTGLPPPFTLGALVPHAQAGVPVSATVNAITTGGYVIRHHIAEPAFAPYAALLGGTSFKAGDLYGVLGIAFSLTNTNDIGTSDYLASMENGDVAAAKLQSLNAMLLSSIAIGARMIVGLISAAGQTISVDQAADAIYMALLPVGFEAMSGSQGFSTSSPATLTAVFQKALGSLKAEPTMPKTVVASSGLTATAPAATPALSPLTLPARRLLQAPPPAGPGGAAIGAVAQATAELNAMLDQLAQAGAAFDGRSAATQMARIVRVAQTDVAVAAPNLLLAPGVPGAISVDAFVASYTGAPLKQRVAAATLAA